jgi:glutathione reductase (NADPH)
MNEDHIFDLIVIGTGTAASAAAHECSSAGWKVSIIDSLSFGGTCALRGCEPKKVLVEAVKVVDSAQRHQNNGVLGSDKIHVKWSDLIHFKRTFTEPFPYTEKKDTRKLELFLFMVMHDLLGRMRSKWKEKKRTIIITRTLFSMAKKFW